MANPFTVQPLGGLQNIQMIGQGMQGIAQNVQADREKQRREALMQQAAEIMDRGNPREIAQFSMQNPEIGESMLGGIKFANEATKANLRDSMQRVIAGEDPVQVLQERVQMVQSQGGDASDSMRELQLAQQDPEAYRQQVEQVFAMSYPREYEAFKSATGDVPADMPMNVREWEYYSSLPEDQQRQYLAMKRSGQTFRQGDVTMAVDPRTQTTAQPITEAGAAPTTQAEQQARLTEQQATQAASKEAATQAIKTSKEAFDQIRPIKSAIANVDEAIRLIDEGAQTGVIASKLPSVQEASIALDNLQGRLGLDVIGNTTFGALSEAELRFALDTALPKNLEGPALKRWLKEKQESQKKLANYLEDAATFLGKPGNTIADFIERQREKDNRSVSDDQSIDALLNKYAPQD